MNSDATCQAEASLPIGGRKGQGVCMRALLFQTRSCRTEELLIKNMNLNLVRVCCFVKRSKIASTRSLITKYVRDEHYRSRTCCSGLFTTSSLRRRFFLSAGSLLLFTKVGKHPSHGFVRKPLSPTWCGRQQSENKLIFPPILYPLD